MRSKLNGRNKIKAVNTWAVALLRYSGGVIRCQRMNSKKNGQDDQESKVMARNKELHGPGSDTTRMYLSRKKGGRGIITDVKLVSVGKRTIYVGM